MRVLSVLAVLAADYSFWRSTGALAAASRKPATAFECGRPDSGGYEARMRTAPGRPFPAGHSCGGGGSAEPSYLSPDEDAGAVLGVLMPVKFAIKVICYG